MMTREELIRFGVSSGLSGLSGLSGVGIGPSFSPADIAGLELWLKADEGTFQDSAKTTPATSDGDVIGAWEDQSGNGNDALQGTTANKPLLKLSILNGRSVTRWDGINDRLVLTTNINDQTITVFCVLRKNIIDAGQFVSYMRTTVAPFLARINVADEWGVYLGGALLSGQSINTFTIITTVIRAVNDVDLVTNGVIVNLATGTGVESGNNFIGSNNTQWLDGDIAEILLYNTPLSNANRELVETYLNTRYAIF